MKKRFVVICLFVLLLFSCSQRGLIRKTYNLQEAEKIQNTDAYLKALNLKYKGQYTNSILNFKKITKTDPNPWVFREIADCFGKLKNLDSAEIYISKAEEDLPNDISILLLKYAILVEKKDFKNALPILTKLVELKPNSYTYLVLLLENLHQMKKYDVIENIIASRFQYFADQKDKTRDLYLKQAAYRTLNKKYDESKEIYSTYLAEIDSNDVDFLFRLNRINILEHNLYKAYKIQSKILNLEPDNIQNYIVMALILKLQKKNEQVESFLKKSVNKFPENIDLRLKLAELFVENNNIEKAIEQFDYLLTKDLLDVNAYNLIAMFYDKIGNKEKAINIYKNTYVRFPDNPRILNNYAYILSEVEHDLTMALLLANKAIKLEENSSFIDTKSWVLYKLTHYKEALEFNELALEKAEFKRELPIILYHKAVILQKMSKFEEAKKAIIKSKELILFVTNEVEKQLILNFYEKIINEYNNKK